MASNDSDSPDPTEAPPRKGPPHPSVPRRPPSAGGRPPVDVPADTHRAPVDLDLGAVRRPAPSLRRPGVAHDVAAAPTVKVATTAPPTITFADATISADPEQAGPMSPDRAPTLVPGDATRVDADEPALSRSSNPAAGGAPDAVARDLAEMPPVRSFQNQSTARGGSAPTGASRRVVVTSEGAAVAQFHAAETLQMKTLAEPPPVSAKGPAPVSPVAETLRMPVLVDSQRSFAAAETLAMPVLSELAETPMSAAPQLVRSRAGAVTRRDPGEDAVSPASHPETMSEQPVTRPRGASGRATTVVDAAHPTAATIPVIWRVLVWLAVAVAGLALALPTAAGAPWKLLLQPTGVTFHALLLLLLLVAVGAAGLSVRAWRTGMSVVALVALGLGWLVMRDAVGADVFDGQPAVGSLWGGAGAGGVMLVAGLALVGGGAMGRAERPRAVGPTVVLLFGFGLLGLVFAGVGVGSDAQVGGVIESLFGAKFTGDRVSAWSMLPAVGLMVPALLLMVPGVAASAGRVLGIAVALLAVAPLFMASAFVSTATEASLVLAPLKATGFAAAGLWLSTMAVASWFRSVDPRA